MTHWTRWTSQIYSEHSIPKKQERKSSGKKTVSSTNGVGNPKSIKNFSNSTPKEQIIQSRNGQKIWTDISAKRTSKWPTDTWYIYNGIICSHQEKQNLAICNYVDGTTGYHGKQNKSVRERQLSHDLSDMKNLKGRVGVGGHGGVKEGNETRWDQEGDKP